MNEETTTTEETTSAAEGEVTNALGDMANNPASEETTTTEETTSAAEGEVTNALGALDKQSGEESSSTQGSEEQKDNDGSCDDIINAIMDGDEQFKGKWNDEQVREMAPLLKEMGVSKEGAARLAVHLAKVQTKQLEAYEIKCRQEQMERIKKQDAENAKMFSKEDYAQIYAGMVRYTKEGGALRSLLTTTELGTDPEVLRILHILGEGAKKETTSPAASGVMGRDTGWAAAFEK